MVNIHEIRNEWLESFEAQKIWYERIADRSRNGEMSASILDEFPEGFPHPAQPRKDRPRLSEELSNLVS